MGNYHLLTTLPFYLLVCVGLFGLFRKSGEAGWKAFVPFLNVMVWLKIVGRPKWWIVWFLLPVVNMIMAVSITIDLLKSFGKEKYWEHILGVLLPFAFFPYVGFNKTDIYEGAWVEVGKPKATKKSEIREWADAILFAGTAAMIIRTFLMEAFMIPTTSMEGSLLAGDFLFVSKFHYGVRMPMVPISLPFIHNTIPGTNMRSYIPWPNLPYSRLPGFKDVDRNDIVVFNYPFNDAVPDNNQDFVVKIPSMKQNYIKRCVAVGGDTLSIVDGQVKINGKDAWNPELIQFDYHVYADRPGLNLKMMEKHGFRVTKNDPNSNLLFIQQDGNQMVYKASASPEKIKKLETMPGITKVVPMILPSSHVSPMPMFPDYGRDQNGDGRFDQGDLKLEYKTNNWNLDNFGPLYIPKKGQTVTLTSKNINFFDRVITAYEHHDLQIQGDKFIIDGVETKEYTFKLNYYWMMGDNRHSSLDSRYWGYVPEDHVVGRPWFVLASFENGIRWDRLFSPIDRWEE